MSIPTSSQDPFDAFAEAYSKGNFLTALQQIVIHPHVHYDWLASQEKAFPFLINFADACVFDNLHAVKKANAALQSAIEADYRLKNKCGSFLSTLQVQRDTLWQKTFPLPLFYNESLKKRALLDHLDTFTQSKPALAECYCPEKNRPLYQPWHLFSYALTPKPLLIDPQGEFPCIFLQPLHNADYSALFAPYAQTPKILIMETVNDFWHLLQFPSLLPVFSDRDNLLYILDMYPKDQFEIQQEKQRYGKTFQFLMLIENENFRNVLPVFSEALSAENGDARLYQIAKRLIFKNRVEKYGKSRCFAVDRAQTIKNWFDVHKHSSSSFEDFGPSPVDYVKERLTETQKQQVRRAYHPRERISIAHVVPQIMDGGHAPSRVLKTIIAHTNFDEFAPCVISTECFISHFLEYPAIERYALNSQFTGAKTIKNFEERHLPAFIIEPNLTYEGSANHAAELLNQLSIDAAVFHGPDQVNNLCGTLCNVPLRVLFEHGTLPVYPCYDLVVMSTLNAAENVDERLARLGMKAHPLIFSLDVRKHWEKTPFSRSELHLPEEAFVMTTISNHLEDRLSPEMCHAIGKILQRCPNAFYAPIGKIKEADRFYAIFSSYGVSDRVIFLGARSNPSQYARSMHLYLNEFPFGSGIAILDAMAAGCPIVSMHDPKGPSQARYGATFFGEDRVVSSGRVDDYVDLACQLAEQPELYRAWSEHALQQYEQRSDEAGYIKNFEEIIKKALFALPHI